MRLRWLGVTGTALLLTSLVLMVAGPRLWPTAFFGAGATAVSGGMMSGGMMDGQNGMMSGGMMGGSGGMVAGGMIGMMMAEDGMVQSMMSGEILGDPAQPFELRFLDQMVPHHQMAVHSAQMMLANFERPELRDLAQRIISAQQAEIEQMGQWRATWFPDASAAPTLTMMAGPGDMMSGMMGGQGGMMNGGMMGDQAQLDRLFLEMMIPHHEAAISMARQALEESQRPEIRTLAEAIISSQTAEIEEMGVCLRDFFGATTPYPPMRAHSNRDAFPDGAFGAGAKR
jgi:uncharacterized protein (DUF305 family)